MSFLDSIFGDSKKTNTTSNQTADQSYGLTPTISNYASSIGGMYNPAAYYSTAGNLAPNQYMTGAASGLQAFLPTVTGASGDMFSLSRSGFTPADIQSFMSPYISSTVDATRADFANQNALQRGQQQAALAKAGALGGTQGPNARAIGDYWREKAQAPVIANLYNQGYQQAGDLAARNAQTRISAAGTGFSGLGTAIGGYGQLGGLGQQYQSAIAQQYLTPYQLAQQGAQTYAGLTPYSGNHSTGTATGTSDTIATPSLWSIGGDIAGTAMKAIPMLASLGLSDERVKDDIKPIGETFDGQPIYKFRFKGSPKTEIGLMAQDVEHHRPEAVTSLNGLKMVDYDTATKGAEREERAGGGSVGLKPFHGSDPHERLATAFHSIRGMLHKANGGRVLKPYAAGGDVGLGSWDATVTPTASPDWKGLGESFQKFGKSDPNSKPAQAGASDDSSRFLADQQAGLNRLMTGMTAAPRPFADGGVPTRDGDIGFSDAVADIPSYAGAVAAATAPTASSASSPSDTSSWLSRAWEKIKEPGLYGGKAPTAWQMFANELQATKSPTMSGPGEGKAQAFLEMNKQRMEQQRVDQELARLMGKMQNGDPTLDAQIATGSVNGKATIPAMNYALEAAKTPAHIRQMNAAAAASEVQADRAFLVEMEKKKLENAKQLELQQQELRWKQMDRLIQEQKAAEDARKAGAATPPPAPGIYKQLPDGSIVLVPKPAAGAP